MFRRFLFSFLIVAFMAIAVISADKTKPGIKTPGKPAPLTDEEKEILKHREILENLELLQNFEKIQYLNFLSDKKVDQSKEQIPAKQAVAKDK